MPPESRETQWLPLHEIVFHNLVVSVLADRKVRPMEEPFLNQARKLLGLNEERAQSIILHAQESPTGIRVPPGEDARKQCFDLMIAACKADNLLHTREEEMLRAAAPHFGVTDADLTERLKGVPREME